MRYYGNTLYYTYDKILTDKYTVWCGITLRNELILSGLFASIITFIVVICIFWYIGRVGKKASDDEITGGRILEDNPKVVARLMRRRGTASHIVIDGLPIVEDSEIQNFAMHGTVGTGIRPHVLDRAEVVNIRLLAFNGAGGHDTARPLKIGVNTVAEL